MAWWRGRKKGLFVGYWRISVGACNRAYSELLYLCPGPTDRSHLLIQPVVHGPFGPRTVFSDSAACRCRVHSRVRRFQTRRFHVSVALLWGHGRTVNSGCPPPHPTPPTPVASTLCQFSWELALRGAFSDVGILSQGGEFSSFQTFPTISVYFQCNSAEKSFGVILFVCSNPVICENYYIMLLHQ